MAAKLKIELEKRGINPIGVLPYDPAVFEACLEGRALGKGTAANQAGKIFDALLTSH